MPCLFFDAPKNKLGAIHYKPLKMVGTSFGFQGIGQQRPGKVLPTILSVEPKAWTPAYLLEHMMDNFSISLSGMWIVESLGRTHLLYWGMHIQCRKSGLKSKIQAWNVVPFQWQRNGDNNMEGLDFGLVSKTPPSSAFSVMAPSGMERKWAALVIWQLLFEKLLFKVQERPWLA